MTSTRVFSPEQVQEFHEKGYIGPFDLLSEREANDYKSSVRKEIDKLDGDLENLEGLHPRTSRHLDSPTVYDLCTRDEIVDKMAAVYGQDLLLWESKLYYRGPDMPAIPWHQYYHHVPLTPKTSITAWIALDDCVARNGCLKVIPNTHTTPLPDVVTPEDVATARMADPKCFDDSEAIEFDLEAGQYVLFSETLVHGFTKNDSTSYRRSVAARATPPHVKFLPEEYGSNPEVENHTMVLLNGEDDFQINEIQGPPDLSL
jgi:ectoine hydroxylase-related dioxygenase (phytanoyl-CoA dioxygenase family)